MNRADIIPVITECRILLPGLFDQGPRQCLFKRLDEGRRKDLKLFFFQAQTLTTSMCQRVSACVKMCAGDDNPISIVKMFQIWGENREERRGDYSRPQHLFPVNPLQGRCSCTALVSPLYSMGEFPYSVISDEADSLPLSGVRGRRRRQSVGGGVGVT